MNVNDILELTNQINFSFLSTLDNLRTIEKDTKDIYFLLSNDFKNIVKEQKDIKNDKRKEL